MSGDIQLSGVQVERLLAKSVSGAIEFGAALERGGRYDFGSHSGDIRIVLSSQTGFELDASTFSGSVRSDFPVTLRSRRRVAIAAASTRTIRGVVRRRRRTAVAQDLQRDRRDQPRNNCARCRMLL